MAEQASLLVAKACVDRSLPAVLIAAKALLAAYVAPGHGREQGQGQAGEEEEEEEQPTPAAVEMEEGSGLPALQVASLLGLLYQAAPPSAAEGGGKDEEAKGSSSSSSSSSSARRGPAAPFASFLQSAASAAARSHAREGRRRRRKEERERRARRQERGAGDDSDDMATSPPPPPRWRRRPRKEGQEEGEGEGEDDAAALLMQLEEMEEENEGSGSAAAAVASASATGGEEEEDAEAAAMAAEEQRMLEEALALSIAAMQTDKEEKEEEAEEDMAAMDVDTAASAASVPPAPGAAAAKQQQEEEEEEDNTERGASSEEEKTLASERRAIAEDPGFFRHANAAPLLRGPLLAAAALPGDGRVPVDTVILALLAFLDEQGAAYRAAVHRLEHARAGEACATAGGRVSQVMAASAASASAEGATSSSSSGSSGGGGSSSRKAAASGSGNGKGSGPPQLPPPPESVQPHPLTLMLLHSLLTDLLALLEGEDKAGDGDGDGGGGSGKPPGLKDDGGMAGGAGGAGTTGRGRSGSTSLRFGSGGGGDNPALEEGPDAEGFMLGGGGEEEEDAIASALLAASKKAAAGVDAVAAAPAGTGGSGGAEMEEQGESQEQAEARARAARRKAFLVAAALSALGILETNLLYASKMGLGASVGLGQVAAPTLSSLLAAAASSSKKDKAAASSSSSASASAAASSSKGEGKKRKSKSSSSSTSALVAAMAGGGGGGSSPLFVTRLRATVERFLGMPELSSALALPFLAAAAAAPGGGGRADGPLATGTTAAALLRSAATGAWATGLEYFYPRAAQRQRLLLLLLGQPPPKGTAQWREDKDRVVDGKEACHVALREPQRAALLPALCLRLAQPDMAGHFFAPPASLARDLPSPLAPLAASGAAAEQEAADSGGAGAESSSAFEGGGAGEGTEAEGEEDDAASTAAGPSAAATTAASAAGGAPSLLALLEAQMEGSAMAAKAAAAVATTATPTATTAGGWPTGPEGGGNPATSSAARLPLVLETLLEQLQDSLPPSPSPTTLAGAKFALLASLQTRLVGVLAAWSGRETDLAQPELDARRCSEHIVLSNGGRTATQRGSKAWGSVLATAAFAPGTGVHSWCVRLDRCEKGHVFIGVCTADASTRTYVGGDKHGWGMIGTKALWHNRAKVRGDYGDGYGSRCTVRVRLDTDRGTLSLGLAGAGPGGGTDWGVAFDKLPRASLYPAIGLYQREDQVTLLPASPSPSEPQPAAATAAAKKGRQAGPAPEQALAARRAAWALGPVTAYTERLARGCHHVLDSLEETGLGDAGARNALASHPFLQRLLPALAAALVQLPSLPSGGGGASALALLPPLTALAKRVDRLLSRGASGGFQREALDRGKALFADVDGEWIVRSGAADSIPAQEYRITLRSRPYANPRQQQQQQQQQPGTGVGGALACRTVRGHGGSPSPAASADSSRPPLPPSAAAAAAAAAACVVVEGAVLGARIRLVESWAQGGACVVEGRLSLDGGAFQGTFRDVRSSTRGPISGRRVARPPSAGSVGEGEVGRHQQQEGVSPVAALARLEVALALLTGKLACLVMVGLADGHKPLLAAAAASSSPSSPPPVAVLEEEDDNAQDDDDRDDEHEREEDDEDDEDRMDTSSQDGAALAAPGGPSQEDASAAPSGVLAAASSGALDDSTVSQGTALSASGGGGGARTASAEEVDEALLRSLAAWRRSRLLSGGLPLAATLDALRAKVQVLPGGEQALQMSAGAGVSPPAAVRGDGWGWWRGAALRVPSEAEAQAADAAAGAPVEPFYTDLMEHQGLALEVDKWVLRHVGESPFARVGGEPMRVARRVVLAALLRHSGALPRVLSEAAGKLQQPPQSPAAAEAGDANNVAARPAEVLLRLWRAAQRVVEWGVRQRQASGLSFQATAGLLEHKAQFLLSLLPSAAARAVAQELAFLSSALHSEEAQHAAATAAALVAAEERSAALVAEAVTFLECGLRDMEALKREMVRQSLAAFDRAAGLRALGLLLGAGSSSPSASSATQQATTPPQGSPSSVADRPLALGVAVAAALQCLAPALLAHADPFALGGPEGMGSGFVALFHQQHQGGPAGGGAGNGNAGLSTTASAVPPGHYLAGLEGAGAFFKDGVTHAFERLYALLAQALYRGSQGDLDTALVVLQAWGLVLRPEDHAFLARAGVFRGLQAVLDGVRPPPAAPSRGAAGLGQGLGQGLGMSHAASSGVLAALASAEEGMEQEEAAEAAQPPPPPPPARKPAVMGVTRGRPEATAERMLLAAKSRVARAALKAVHLLAGQVAASSSSSWSGGDEQHHQAGAARSGLVPPPLERQQSGPATLGAELFAMLHGELRCALRQAAEAQLPFAPPPPPLLLQPGGGSSAMSTSGSTSPPRPPALSRGPSQAASSSSTGSATAAASAAAASAARAGGAGGGGGWEDEGLSSEQYCHRLLGLLQSVATAATCQRHLTTAKWLRVLIGGLQAGSPATQRRVFRLLRQVLPSLDPAAFTVRVPALGEPGALLALLEYEEDEGEEAAAAAAMASSQGPDEQPAAAFVNLLMEAVAAGMPRRLVPPAEKDKAAPPEGRFAVEGSHLWSEAVALARRLLGDSKWRPLLQRWLLEGLEGLPPALHFQQDGEAGAAAAAAAAEGGEGGRVRVVDPPPTALPGPCGHQRPGGAGGGDAPRRAREPPAPDLARADGRGAVPGPAAGGHGAGDGRARRAGGPPRQGCCCCCLQHLLL